MKRLNRKEEAVSPVIATILMVAITVVLAATLYMMVGDIGGEGVASLSASITHRDDTQMEIVSMSNPGSADTSDITITVFDTDGGELGSDSGDELDWSLVEDDNGDNEIATGGSRFDVESIEDDEDNIGEVVFQVDGYDGTASYEF